MSASASSVKRDGDGPVKAPIRVRFLGEDCDVHFGVYAEGGNLAIQLVSEGGPMGSATINVPGLSLNRDEIAVKSFGENAGMYEALLEAGLIEPFDRQARIGFTICPIASLTAAAIEQARAAGVAV